MDIELNYWHKQKLNITRSCLLLYSRFLTHLIKWGLSENAKIFLLLSAKCSIWVFELPNFPLIPISDHTRRLVWAPSETNPWTRAPAFSRSNTALIINFASVCPLSNWSFGCKHSDRLCIIISYGLEHKN